MGAVGYHNGFIEWLEPDGSGLVNRIDGGSFSGSLATSDITRTNITIAGPPTQQAGALVTGFVDVGAFVPVVVNFQFIDLGDSTSNVPEAQGTMPLLCLACVGLGLYRRFQCPAPRYQASGAGIAIDYAKAGHREVIGKRAACKSVAVGLFRY